ncbi:MAG: DUF1780 domain-containing protein [Acidobacteria bacterium]|nr:DUF1780 domain-containing protein [Acidobacteriota bacterium]
MDEREILDVLENAAWDNVKYFSNANKDQRERWVVSKFLSILNVEYREEEIRSLAQHSKVDVCFRGASFQIKELTDPDLRRGKMYKDAYASIKAAKSLDEVSLIGDVQDVPPIANMYELVLEMAKELAGGKSYSPSKGQLDLLIYVTRTRASLIHPDEITDEAFSGLGWRSVSFVNEKQAGVLFSSPSAADFLKERATILMNAVPNRD